LVVDTIFRYDFALFLAFAPQLSHAFFGGSDRCTHTHVLQRECGLFVCNW
jgi:hypothetical protein